MPLKAWLDFVAALAAIFVPLFTAVVIGLWRTGRKIDRNATSIDNLAEAINGTVNQEGLRAQVADLVLWKARQEERQALHDRGMLTEPAPHAPIAAPGG